MSRVCHRRSGTRQVAVRAQRRRAAGKPIRRVAARLEGRVQALDFASSNFRDGKPVRFEEVSRYTGADLVTRFEQEHWETKVGRRSELSPFDLRVTTTFRLEVDSWKLIGRHADPLTTAHVDGPLRPSG